MRRSRTIESWAAGRVLHRRAKHKSRRAITGTDRADRVFGGLSDASAGSKEWTHSMVPRLS